MQLKQADINHRAFRLTDLRDERTELFGLPLETALRRKQVELEIGCGVGWHPIETAKNLLADEQALIAIERTNNKFLAFKRRFENHPHLQNVLTGVHADAFHFIAQAIPDQALGKIWMLYPNPEIKRPNNRWYRSPGFRRALMALRLGGRFHFATNLSEYALAGEAQTTRLGLRLLEKQLITKTDQPNFSPRTHFEKKYYERGEQLFDYTFEKVNEAP